MAITSRKSGEQVYPSEGEPRAGCRDCGCNDMRAMGGRRVCRRCGSVAGRMLAKPAPEARPSADTGGVELAADDKDVCGDTHSHGVIYRPVRCPACESKKTRVTKTMVPLRYHKCNECGHNFKSMEQ